MANGLSADRTAELLLWYHREPSRYFAEGRRRNAPRGDSDVVFKLAQGRRVSFANSALNDPRMSIALKSAAVAYIRNVYFHPDNSPYQTLGLAPGASQDEIRENFRQLMHLVHPDRQGDHKQWPDACAAQANRAYGLLRDPQARDRLEREAEARAALARAISKAAAAAEASQMPVAMWPKPERSAKRFAQPVLPEWLTAGVGGYARKNPAVVSFLLLIFGAALFVVVSAWSGQDGMLVRGARETYASAESLIARADPIRSTRDKGTVEATGEPAGKGRLVASTPASSGVGIASTMAGPTVKPPDPVASGAKAATPVATALDSGAVAAPDTAPPIFVAAPAVPPPAVAAPAVAAPAFASPSAPGGAPTVGPSATEATVGPSDPQRASPSMASAAAEVPAMAMAIAPAPIGPAATTAPAGSEIEALFASFVETYERGRLDAFAALFDDDADTNLHRGRTAIRAEYDELFRLSQWRRMQLTRVNWRRSGDRAIAKGEITVKIGWRDGREVEQRLNLDMELMRRDGRVVIARMTHQPKSP